MGRKFYPPPTATTAATTTVAAAGALATSLPCAQCGYDLRASPKHCPECGLAVEETIRRRTRTLSRRMRSRAANRLAFFAVVCLLLGAILFVALISTLNLPIDVGNPLVMLVSFIAELVFGLAFLVVGCASLAYYVAAVWRNRRADGFRPS